MPPAGLLAAAAIAAALYLGGVQVVHGAKKLGHVVKAGVSRLVHPHRAATTPDPSEE